MDQAIRDVRIVCNVDLYFTFTEFFVPRLGVLFKGGGRRGFVFLIFLAVAPAFFRRLGRLYASGLELFLLSESLSFLLLFLLLLLDPLASLSRGFKCGFLQLSEGLANVDGFVGELAVLEDVALPRAYDLSLGELEEYVLRLEVGVDDAAYAVQVVKAYQDLLRDRPDDWERGLCGTYSFVLVVLDYLE